MKSIIETTIELINNKGDFVSFSEIIDNIDNDAYDKNDIQAIIYSDLLTDGRFFLKEGEWNLKDNFTIKELNKIRSQGIVDDLLYNEEIQVDKDEDIVKVDDAMTDVDDFEEIDEIDITEIVDEDILEVDGDVDIDA